MRIYHRLSLLSRAEIIAKLRKLNSPWHLRKAVRSLEGAGKTRLDRAVAGGPEPIVPLIAAKLRRPLIRSS